MAADYTSTGATEANDGTDINSGDGANATVHEDPHSHGQCGKGVHQHGCA